MDEVLNYQPQSVTLDKVKRKNNMIRIVLADDHPAILNGLPLAFENEKDIEIVAKLKNGEEIISCLEQQYQLGKYIDVVLTDIFMPKLDGFEVVEQMVASKKYPKTNVILYSMKVDEAKVAKAIKLGIQGYLYKGCSMFKIVEAVRSITQNDESYFSEEVRNLVPAAKELLTMMPTPREREILVYLEQGLPVKEIVEELIPKKTKDGNSEKISIYTVRDHIKHMREKYEANSVAELLHILRKRGIL